MYGLPKVHKEGTPFRLNLAIINSAQHNLDKQLSLLLEPVLTKYCTRALKDSFCFVNELREQKFDNYSDLTMRSFDITSLLRNVSLEETIQTCIDTRYHSDFSAPQISVRHVS